MFSVIALITFSVFLSCKSKLYFFCFLPIILFLNYMFFFFVMNTSYFDSDFLDRTLEVFNLNSESLKIDFKLVNKITNSITFFYIQIIVCSYIFSKTSIIKKLSTKLLQNLNQSLFKLNLDETSFANYKDQKNKLNNYEIFLLIIIITHAIAFYSSDFLLFHEKYLFINKEEYYSLYPRLATILTRSLNVVFPIFFLSRIVKSETKFFKDPTNLIVFFHSIILYSSVNSRWVFVYLTAFTLYFFLKIYRDSKNKFSKKLFSLIILFSGSYLSMIFFSKSLFFRSKLSGLGTLLFTLNDIQFSINSSLKNILTSTLSSLFVIYSGIDLNIQTSLKYDIISLVPLPSYVMRVKESVLQQVAKVSNFAPSPTYVQIYQNNYFYELIIIILFGFVLSIIISQRKILRFKHEKYKILSFYPNAYEILITFILYYGFQYYSRTVITYLWWTILFLIIFPLILGKFMISKENY